MNKTEDTNSQTRKSFAEQLPFSVQESVSTVEHVLMINMKLSSIPLFKSTMVFLTHQVFAMRITRATSSVSAIFRMRHRVLG